MQNQDQLPEEEVNQPEQVQVGGTPEENETHNGTAGIEEIGYTPGESEFADGAGTRLDQEIEELESGPDPDSDNENEESQEREEREQRDEQSDPETTEEDADFENPEDDPA